MTNSSIEGMGVTVDSDGSYPYSTYEGSDFAKNLAAPDIDFGVFHLYTEDCEYCSTLVVTGLSIDASYQGASKTTAGATAG